MNAKEIIFKLIDEEGLTSLVVDDLMDSVVKNKLDELVLKTDNALDNALVEMIYPLVRAEVVKFLSEQLASLQE